MKLPKTTLYRITSYLENADGTLDYEMEGLEEYVHCPNCEALISSLTDDFNFYLGKRKCPNCKKLFNITNIEEN